MESSCIFLDTNICIDKVFNNETFIQKIEKINKVDELLTSTFVVGEFVRTVLMDCCALHTMVLEENLLTDVYRRIHKMIESGEKHKERVGKRYDLILKSLNYPTDPNKEQTLTNLSNLIRFGLMPSLVHNLKIIKSKTKCVLNSCHPKKHSGSYDINIPCTETAEEVHCEISKFLSDSMQILKNISNQLKNENEPYYLQLIDLIEDFSNKTNLHSSLEECIILGDVIVLFDCPQECTILSADHHIEKLCGITGQNYHIID